MAIFDAMRFSRRRFLRTGVAASATLFASGTLDLLLARIAEGARLDTKGYGPLIKDPEGLLDLPAGFTYRAFSTSFSGATDHARFSQKLDNGDPVPALHDGMGAFAGPNGVTILVRNHEIRPDQLPRVDPSRLRPYDPMGAGGTTTLWIDSERRLVRSFASLSGTFRNCAGGVTPWGSWLSCEECTYMPGPKVAHSYDQTPDVSKRHGYVFEVDSRATDLVEPAPILPMGRFYHEAVAVDPATGHVYMTEDRDDGLVYRYRPDVVEHRVKHPKDLAVGDLAKGGVLEALRIVDQPRAHTQNWHAPDFALGRKHRVDWVRIPNIDPDVDMERDPSAEAVAPLERPSRTAPGSIRGQGFGLGAAQFARAEGMIYAHGSVYVCCTSGGAAHNGQVWRLETGPQRLSLVAEPNELALLDGPDNLTMAPHGDLIVCEDGHDDDYLVGITPAGRLYHLGRAAAGTSELAGACFSPDGRTLFVNIQNPGITFAIQGPWEARA